MLAPIDPATAHIPGAGARCASAGVAANGRRNKVTTEIAVLRMPYGKAKRVPRLQGPTVTSAAASIVTGKTGRRRDRQPEIDGFSAAPRARAEPVDQNLQRVSPSR